MTKLSSSDLVQFHFIFLLKRGDCVGLVYNGHSLTNWVTWLDLTDRGRHERRDEGNGATVGGGGLPKNIGKGCYSQWGK